MRATDSVWHLPNTSQGHDAEWHKARKRKFGQRVTAPNLQNGIGIRIYVGTQTTQNGHTRWIPHNSYRVIVFWLFAIVFSSSIVLSCLSIYNLNTKEFETTLVSCGRRNLTSGRRNLTLALALFGLQFIKLCSIASSLVPHWSLNSVMSGNVAGTQSNRKD